MPHLREWFYLKASVSCHISGGGVVPRWVSHATSLGVTLYHDGCLMPHLWGVALYHGGCLMPHLWGWLCTMAGVSCHISGDGFVPWRVSHTTSLGVALYHGGCLMRHLWEWFCPKASVSCHISREGGGRREALYHGGCLMPHLWGWFCPKASVSCHTPCRELCPRVGVLCTTLTMALSCWEVSLYAANLIANVTGRSYHFYPLL